MKSQKISLQKICLAGVAALALMAGCHSHKTQPPTAQDIDAPAEQQSAGSRRRFSNR